MDVEEVVAEQADLGRRCGGRGVFERMASNLAARL